MKNHLNYSLTKSQNNAVKNNLGRSRSWRICESFIIEYVVFKLTKSEFSWFARHYIHGRQRKFGCSHICPLRQQNVFPLGSNKMPHWNVYRINVANISQGQTLQVSVYGLPLTGVHYT